MHLSPRRVSLKGKVYEKKIKSQRCECKQRTIRSRTPDSPIGDCEWCGKTYLYDFELNQWKEHNYVGKHEKELIKWKRILKKA